MRTLLLTSSGMVMKDKLLQILPGPADMLKVAYITTAAKPEENKDYLIKDKNKLIECGFAVEDVDIEGLHRFDLRDKLLTFDVIYVQGGNTFYLLDAMHRCHFSEVIREVLDNGAIYVGVSAGSIVAGPDISIAKWKMVDANDVGLSDLTGLYLIDFGVFPHFSGKMNESVAKEVIKAPYDVKFLKDNEAFLVRGRSVELLKV